MSETDEIDSRLTQALERAPDVEIPEGFALRVALRAPARPRFDRTAMVASHAGSRVAVPVAALLLLVAIFLLAVAGHSMGWLEAGLAIEFAVLTAWVGLRVVLGE